MSTDASSSPPPPSSSPSSSSILNVDFPWTAPRFVGIFALMIALVVVIILLVRYNWLGTGRRRAPGPLGPQAQASNGKKPEESGLDPRTIEELGPSWKYTGPSDFIRSRSGSEGEKAGLSSSQDERDCVVCLGEYEPGETLRKLNSCSHVFHRECIDAWLSARSSCPLCRISLAPPRAQEDQSLVVSSERPEVTLPEVGTSGRSEEDLEAGQGRQLEVGVGNSQLSVSAATSLTAHS